MKTEFEEIWSEIHYGELSDEYINSLRFWYLDREGLRFVFLKDMEELPDNIIGVWHYDSNGLLVRDLIPRYRFYAIDDGEKFLLDRREGYQGEKSMDIDPFGDVENSVSD